MAMQKYYTMKNAYSIIGVILLSTFMFQANAAITAISAASGKIYQASILHVGSIQYIDRTFTFTNVDALGNREFIQTANNDKNSTGSNFLTFVITQSALVCVAHDDRITQKPTWLSQFTLTNSDLVTTDGHPFSIYTKFFNAGTVILGGNVPSVDGANISMYSVAVVDSLRPTISDIQVANGRTYQISTVALNAQQYVDRDYVFTQIGTLGGRQFIKAFNNDKSIVSNAFLSFTINIDATIYVAHDDRITTKPTWLSGFTDTGMLILNSDDTHPLSIFKKNFPAGRVTLGGNVQTTPSGNQFSMYTVIIGDAVTP
jgi:hypothetical protein